MRRGFNSLRGDVKVTNEEIRNRFGFHPATETTKVLHEEVREGFILLAQGLVAMVPEGREASLMLTALEEAMFWANAGVARNLAPLEY